MKNFLKENWFKIVITITLLIIAISAVYYFVISPKQQGQKNDITLQTQCADQANKAYKNLGYPNQSDSYDEYTNHYNQQLNKCFINISAYINAANMLYALYDANELKEIANFAASRNINDTNFKDTVLSCDFNGKTDVNCSIDSYNNFIKPYMEN